MTDVELLDQHRSGSEEAFASLVRRHLGWIYGMARRRLRDAHRAEDVAQAVFVLLHRKSPRFSADSAVASWLHKTAWYATETAARAQRRRVKYESEAAILSPIIHDPVDGGEEWAELAPLLDKLIEQLPRLDRQAVLLRYYREMSFAEVGAEIGASPDAARKRVERAIDKLRQLAARNGAVLSAQTLTTLMASHLHIAPPAGLTAAAIVTASANAGSTLAGGTGAIVEGASAMMAIKLAVVIASAAAVVGAAGGAAVFVAFNQARQSPAVTILQYPPQPSAIIAATSSRADQPTPQATPYADIRWRGTIPEILVDGIWYEWIAIDDLPATQIVDFTRRSVGDTYPQYFADQLVLILTAMAHPPASTVKLALLTLDTRQPVVLPNVAMIENKIPAARRPHEAVAAFSAVQWNGSTPRVLVNGTWYELLAVDDLSADQIVAFAQKTYGNTVMPDGLPLWQKRFEEDLVEVMTRMRQAPKMSVNLKLTTLVGKQVILNDVPLTAAKREEILNTHNTTNLP